jgi:NTE family protein
VRALVLGGGGIAGAAWEIGILHGLGQSVLDVDLILATSLGSALAAMLTSGVSLTEAYAQHTMPMPDAPVAPIEQLIEMFATLKSLPTIEARRKIGAMAMAADTMPEDRWRQRIAACLRSHSWPAQDIATVAIDVDTGEERIFTRESGVDLVSAIAAGSAVPGTYPPVTIDGNRYMDGGIRSSTNVDLVEDYDEILLLAPIPDSLRVAHARVISPDDASLAAMAMNPLDPATVVPSARAGLAQAGALR